MKVLNLCCANDHSFEGWFASVDEFQSQLGRGLVECPLCADTTVSRRPTAPRLNLSGARAPAESPSPAAEPTMPSAEPASPSPVERQALWLKAVQHVLKTTEDVGERFAEEARRIHYGEASHRGIRGQASAEQRAELADEGIEVMALPLPAGLKGQSH